MPHERGKEMNSSTMDVSALLLTEDSADSEDDYGFFSVCPSSIAISDDNEDDAESCSCDTTTSTCGLPKDGEDDQGFAEFCGNEVTALEDEAEIRIDQVIVNESEDRLFWETCMAVGYP
ncbi:hypothetical protein JHK86_019829 [Glycine max]|nr:hypothetical protein JHK86_019829 [Glycine max]